MRVLEAYVGEYASGKSEVAINRALELVGARRTTCLVDLDVVEPFYTLRPIKEMLEGKGLKVIAWETRTMFGLGETGTLLHPGVKGVLRFAGDIVLDVGYGIWGAKTLNLVEGIWRQSELRIYVVCNICRPMTAGVEDIVELVQNMGKVSGLVNNTHLGDETTDDEVQKGALVVAEAAGQLALPVIATTAVPEVAGRIGERDQAGNPVKVIQRYMTEAFW